MTFTGEYQLTYEEFREASDALLQPSGRRRGGRTIFGWALFVGMVSMLLVFFQTQRSATPGSTPSPSPDALPPDLMPMLRELLPWGFLFGVGWLLMLVAKRFLPRKTYDSNPSYHRPRSVTIDESGVRFVDHVSDVHYRWDAFTALEESKSLFLLYTAKKAAHPIPKRAFADRDLSRIGEFLRSRINSPGSAFPVIGRSGMP